MKKRVGGVLGVLLTACAYNYPPTSVENVPEKVLANTYKIFAGIPLLASLEGSSVRYSADWVLTSAHNELILQLTGKEYYKHPICDIALYKDVIDNDTHTPRITTGLVYQGEMMYHTGYPIGLPMTVSGGIYIGDIIEKDGCRYSVSSAGIIGGTSGGGVWNSNNELVGITRGYIKGTTKWGDGREAKDHGVFVPLAGYQDWIDSIVDKY